MEIVRRLERIIRRLNRPEVLRTIRLAGMSTPRTTSDKELGRPRVYIASTLPDADAATVCEDYFQRLAAVRPSVGTGPASPEIRRETRVLVKINLNTADPYPASTDPVMLKALLIFLHNAGFRQVQVGDCSAISAVPTRGVAVRAGILQAVEGLADFVCFDKKPWLKIESALPLLPSVSVPQAVCEADFLIHLANLKTHSLADFSFGMKLGVGYMHPLERYALHRGDLQEKTAELSALIQPDWTIVDGRQAFVCGGPAVGRIEAGHVIIAGRDPLSVDVAAYRHLYKLKQRFGCVEGFQENPFAMRQFSHKRSMAAGKDSWQEYDLHSI